MKDKFKAYRDKKLVKFYTELANNHGNILEACRTINIDYLILRNWMRFDKELKRRLEELASSSSDELAVLLGNRFKTRTKKSPQIINAILEAIAHGIGIAVACEQVGGVNYQVFYTWCKEDPELEKRVHSVKESNIRRIESVFLQKLLEGKGSPFEYIFFLTNKLPEEYKNQQHISHEVSESLVEKFKGKSVPELQDYARKLITDGRTSDN